jgi:hypothetical protein
MTKLSFASLSRKARRLGLELSRKQSYRFLEDPETGRAYRYMIGEPQFTPDRGFHSLADVGEALERAEDMREWRTGTEHLASPDLTQAA